jgi:RING finger protein 121
MHKVKCFYKDRGWTIIGKKDVCPYCKEIVDLGPFKKNPWDETKQIYLNLLDMVRYVLVWNPIIFVFIHYIFVFLKLS